jgi:hypothetical protein
MIKVKTPIDQLFEFIEMNSPVKESKIPKSLKKLETFDRYIELLETKCMIEVQSRLFSSDRTFVFKTSQRPMATTPWSLAPFRY